MKIKEIWFDAEHIYGRDEEGHEYSQSLLWYPKLRTATDEEGLLTLSVSMASTGADLTRTSVSRVSLTTIPSQRPYSGSSLPIRK